MPLSRPTVAQAITFDFWNTLVAEGASAGARSRRWSSLFEERGHEIDQADFERAMADLWSWFTGRWEGNAVVTPEDAATQALVLLKIDDEALLGPMVETLRAGTDPSELRIADGVLDALEGLRSQGVKVGIISDVGMTPSTTLRRYLEHHDVLGHFDAWSFSDEVGCFKPDERIFRHAAESLGFAADAQLVHIGDLRRTDVAGARASGWTSVRYAGFFDDGADLPEADHVIDHHADLPALLASL